MSTIQALYSKSAFQWCLLPKRPVVAPSQYSHRQPNTTTWGGTGTITGLVEVGTVPVKRRVRLYETSTGILLWEIWANDNGTYAFPYLSKIIDFTVTSVDCTGVYNDVIAARVRAV